MAGDIAQFFGAAKSYQHGVIALTAGTGTATIAAVDTTKYILLHQGAESGSTSPGNCRLTLTNATTITASWNGVTGNVNYTIVDFY